MLLCHPLKGACQEKKPSQGKKNNLSLPMFL